MSSFSSKIAGKLQVFSNLITLVFMTQSLLKFYDLRKFYNK